MRKSVCALLMLILVLAAPVSAHQELEDSETEDHGGEDFILNLMNLNQIIMSIIAISGVATASYYLRGGLLAKPLIVTGIGISLFALERLWYTAGSFRIVNIPSESVTTSLYLASSIFFAAGYIAIAYRMK